MREERGEWGTSERGGEKRREERREKERGKKKENCVFISQYSEIFQFLQGKMNAREPQFYF